MFFCDLEACNLVGENNQLQGKVHSLLIQVIVALSWNVTNVLDDCSFSRVPEKC
jgi:hypothetical protein